MAATKPRILVVLTSVDKIPKNGKPIGWYLPELAHPYHVLSPKADLVIASPKGGEAPLDQVSVDLFQEDPVCADFLANHKPLWQQTQKLSDFAGRAGEFDAIFFPGGHGPMFDLVDDADSLALIRDVYAQGKVVSAVCHGPAALLKATTANGEPLLKDVEVTAFDDAGEAMFQYTDDMDFSLEQELIKVTGGKFVKAEDGPLGEKVVVQGKIITGQNPASSYGVGNEVLKALGL